MHPDYTVRMHPIALEDLVDIEEFIARQSPASAETYVSRITKAIASLSRMPARFRVIGLRKHPSARRMIVGSHLVLFSIDRATSTVLVFRVVHASRRMRSHLLP